MIVKQRHHLRLLHGTRSQRTMMDKAVREKDTRTTVTTTIPTMTGIAITGIALAVDLRHRSGRGWKMTNIL